MPKIRKGAEGAEVKPDREWIVSRLAELGITQDEVTIKFKTYRMMVQRMIGGKRPIRPDEALQWAEILRIPVLECFRKFGYPLPSPTVPVIGAVKSNGRVIVWPPSKIETIEAPTEHSADMRAVVVEADTPELQLFDGAHLYYRPAKIVDPAANGRLAVLEIGDVSAPVVGVLYRVSARTKKVEIFGGRERFETEQLISAAPVLWQRCA